MSDRLRQSGAERFVTKGVASPKRRQSTVSVLPHFLGITLRDGTRKQLGELTDPERQGHVAALVTVFDAKTIRADIRTVTAPPKNVVARSVIPFLREDRGLTVRDIGELIGRSEATASRIGSGRLTLRDRKKFLALVEATGWSTKLREAAIAEFDAEATSTI